MTADPSAQRRIASRLFARPPAIEGPEPGPDILLAALLREGEARGAGVRGALDLLLGRLGAPTAARR